MILNELVVPINMPEEVWHEMSGLFVYQGTLTSSDVCGALYLEDDEDIDQDNEIVFEFLQRYIDTLTEEGMQYRPR